MRARKLLAVAFTVGLGAIGGLIFYALHLPAAFLTGSAVAVTIGVLAHAPLSLPNPLRALTFSILGTMMGAGIDPEALTQLVTLPVALVGLLLVIVGATAAGYAMLRYIGGWDPLTALCGSIPGNFSVVMAVSSDRGARMEQVVMAQVTRLFILVSVLPFVFGTGEHGVGRPTAPPDYTILDVLETVLVAGMSAFTAIKLRLPAPAMLGPLLVSTILSTTGLLTIAVPLWLSSAAFTVLGASVAVRFSTIRREGFRRMLLASLASFVAAFAVAMAIAVVVSLLIDQPLGAIFLGYAPGGLDAMIGLSFLLGFEVAFVAVLHAARMILLSLGMPLFVAVMMRRADRNRNASTRKSR
ncbi:AbrB family transcriptional regulator [Acuticoccus mangrovi]|uniref:AbrB family transcriptional regulator n=1 Tax=Acuticoccus mangrovi TaxID=2796142 RepID=A0A934IQM0_9HYPH|nr:AbrB family transcriptional regulator [Acuticoccus mangrovi]MBJ3775809.1 AbrB family transcriptional regulator [Acuticoccus mangrovi]